MAKMPGNIISLTIPDADLQVARAALQTLTDHLNPHLVNLTPEERQAMPRVGPASPSVN